MYTKLLRMYLGKPAGPPVPLGHDESGSADAQPLDNHARGRGRANVQADQGQGAGSANSEPSANADSAQPADATSAFAEENARRRASVGEYVDSNPLPRLVVMKRVLQPIHDFLTKMLATSSKAWERKQKAIAATGRDRSYIILEDARGESVATTMGQLLGTIQEDAFGFPTPSVPCAFRALKFCMASATMCAVHSLIRLSHSGLPYQLFRLLDEPSAAADRLLALPDCMLDQLFTELKKMFPTKKLLMGPEAQVIISTLASVASTNIADVEAAHNSTRDFSSIRSRGWSCSLEALSARFVLQQKLRLLGGTNIRGNDKKEALVKRSMAALRCNPSPSLGEAVEGVRKKRGGGGGAWRAFVSYHLPNKKLTAALAADLSSRYRQLDDAQKEWFAKAGAAGTRAHRHGHAAFGKRAPPQALPGEQAAANPDAIVAVDAERDDFSMVLLGYESFSEKYEAFKQSLPKAPVHETDPLMVSAEQSQAMALVQQDLSSLQMVQALENQGHTDIAAAFEGNSYTKATKGCAGNGSGSSQEDTPSVARFSWCAPSEKVVQAGECLG